MSLRIQMTPLNVPKSDLSANDLPQMKGRLKATELLLRKFQGESRQRVGSADSSIYTSSYTHLSPIGPWTIAFGSLLIGTINTWDENDSSTNASHVVSLSSMAATAVYTAFIYWRNAKQAALAQERSDELSQLNTLLSTVTFLRSSSKMAKRCLMEPLPNNLEWSYSQFQKSIEASPAQDAENLLVVEWAEIAPFIHSEQKEGLKERIEGQILPLIHAYAKQVDQNLVNLGYPPLAQDEEALEE